MAWVREGAAPTSLARFPCHVGADQSSRCFASFLNSLPLQCEGHTDDGGRSWSHRSAATRAVVTREAAL
uniref:Uncharacterized protein n=1 Tax=Oryza sativa subsp. japonica TaxID=39947 RepID=Q6ZKQ4_ORYSJ|nr:hypothetical protein [Oryza sativa Japonica Group]